MEPERDLLRSCGIDPPRRGVPRRGVFLQQHGAVHPEVLAARHRQLHRLQLGGHRTQYEHRDRNHYLFRKCQTGL
jgi:hypothetical protein